jgi:hypothetical protein
MFSMSGSDLKEKDNPGAPLMPENDPITEPGNEPQSFIVRIWHETASSKGPGSIWRGSIVHVGSGKRVYFHDLERIKRFIQDQTGMRYNLFAIRLKEWLARIGH